MRLHKQGFTLAEILIALALIAVLAAFTIPKLMPSSNSEKFNSIAKEAMGSVMEAFFKAKQEGRLIQGQTKCSEVIGSYMNVTPLTSGVMDGFENANPYEDYSCDPTATINPRRLVFCFSMPNGASLGSRFDLYYASNPNVACLLGLDPDGRRTSTSPGGSGKSLALFIYADGSIRTTANMKANTVILRDDGSGNYLSSPLVLQPNDVRFKDPSWLKW